MKNLVLDVAKEKNKEKDKLIKKIVKPIKKKVEKPEPAKEEMKIEDPFDILKFILMTEKSVRLIESENKLVFIVSRKSNKNEIKNAFESMFASKVKSVKTLIDQKGRKKAFIKLEKPGEAGEIAMRLGVI